MTRPHFQFWPRRLPHNITSPQTSLWYNLEVSARRYPDKDAVIFYGRHTTFRELHDDALAVAARNVGMVVDLYHDDARLLAPGFEPAEGKPAIQATLQALLDMGATSLDVEPLDVREGGDLTVEYGRYRLGIEADGASMVDLGKYIVVHETRDGETKIVLDCFNSNAPPPGA